MKPRDERSRGIYDDRAFERMPILADALQDVGCDNDDILNHMRDSNAAHVCGCWALDLVLWKSEISKCFIFVNLSFLHIAPGGIEVLNVRAGLQCHLPSLTNSEKAAIFDMGERHTTPSARLT